jgi:hypothetical protein
MAVIQTKLIAQIALFSIAFAELTATGAMAQQTHCLPTNIPHWRVCPMPPVAVAERGDSSELASWGLPVRPSPVSRPKEYAD